MDAKDESQWIFLGLSTLTSDSGSHEGFGWDALYTTWWFQFLLIFSPTWGDDPIWQAYFSNGWFNHQLD